MHSLSFIARTLNWVRIYVCENKSVFPVRYLHFDVTGKHWIKTGEVHVKMENFHYFGMFTETIEKIIVKLENNTTDSVTGVCRYLRKTRSSVPGASVVHLEHQKMYRFYFRPYSGETLADESLLFTPSMKDIITDSDNLERDELNYKCKLSEEFHKYGYFVDLGYTGRKLSEFTRFFLQPIEKGPSGEDAIFCEFTEYRRPPSFVPLLMLSIIAL